jgi:hypothetical protein
VLGTTNERKFQVSVGWRDSYANQLYDYSHRNRQLTAALKPKEWLNSLDVTASYNFSRRVSLTGTMPIALNRISLLIPPDPGGSSSRFGLPGAGLGDVSLLARSWLLNPVEHPTANVSLGTGVKIQTGNWNPHYTYPDVFGNIQRKAVLPPSIIPGDGGTGAILELVSYKTFTGKLLNGGTLIVSGSYLINPRNTNNTLSAISLLGLSNPLAANAVTNSVPDSYAVRTLMTLPIPGTRQIASGNVASGKIRSVVLKQTRIGVSYRWEGTRQRDLFGGNRGFRQPGYVMAIGPFISIPFVAQTKLNIEVPITISGKIEPSPETPVGVPLRKFGLIAPVGVLVRLTRSI